jgi:hypothetical protein
VTPSDPSDHSIFPNVEIQANEIVLLVRSRLQNQLQRLRESTGEPPGGSRWGSKPPTAHDSGLGRDLWWRVFRNRFARDEQAILAAQRSQARTELSGLMQQLTLKIQQFLDSAAFAGSPAEYQQDLRESQLALNRLYENEADKQELSTETFRRLTEIVDLVQLTRRDVQRRAVDDPAVAANFVRAWLPADRVSNFEESIGLPQGALKEMPNNLTDEQLRRIRLAAQLIFDLRFSHTPEGLVDWFYQRLPEFDDQQPTDLINQPQRESELRTWARGLRSQLAS